MKRDPGSVKFLVPKKFGTKGLGGSWFGTVGWLPEIRGRRRPWDLFFSTHFFAPAQSVHRSACYIRPSPISGACWPRWVHRPPPRLGVQGHGRELKQRAGVRSQACERSERHPPSLQRASGGFRRPWCPWLGPSPSQPT